MTQRLGLVALVAATCGAILGGGGVEVYHRSRLKNSTEFFGQRLKCNSLGREWQRAKSTEDRISGYNVDRIDFSVGRNSCIAEVEAEFADSTKSVQVVDLGTNETLYSAYCNARDECGANGGYAAVLKKEEGVFDQALGVTKFEN